MPLAIRRPGTLSSDDHQAASSASATNCASDRGPSPDILRKSGRVGDMRPLAVPRSATGDLEGIRRKPSSSCPCNMHSTSAPALCNRLVRRYAPPMDSRTPAHGSAPRRVRLSIALSRAVLTPGLAAASSALADLPTSVDLPTPWAALANESAMRALKNPKPDLSSRIEACKSCVIAALEIPGFEVIVERDQPALRKQRRLQEQAVDVRQLADQGYDRHLLRPPRARAVGAVDGR